MRRTSIFAILLFGGCSERPVEKPTVVIGAKKFTESYLLAEMGASLCRQAGAHAESKDLGSTPTLWLALTQGDIDAYPEYTGTITRQILKDNPTDLDAALAVHGVRMGKPFGFRNNYALGMRKDVAASRNISKISDLRNHADLRCGFIPEFRDRPDGWPGLKRVYGLPQENVREMNHTLAYAAVVDKSLDLTEIYTTDGEIVQHDLLVLRDDLDFFPAYQAIWLYRADLERRLPGAVAQLRRMEGRIGEPDMRAMNTDVQFRDKTVNGVSAAFLASKGIDAVPTVDPSLAERVGSTTSEHLQLVVPSLLAAMLVAIPLGILASNRMRLGQAVLATTGVLQTIPSLALLLFLMPLTKWLLGSGIGAPTAIAALFLYSLLPIVRNTYTGLTGIAPALRESAEALGLTRWAILGRVELPLAAPTILAGVKTAAVINVGTATLGGFIGAGGYGRPILRGIDKGDIPMMLEGAVPAALMAILVEGAFGLLERWIARRRANKTPPRHPGLTPPSSAPPVAISSGGAARSIAPDARGSTAPKHRGSAG